MSHVSGMLSSWNDGAARRAVVEFVEGTVVLDLAGMTFIDSQGIKVLVEANKRAQLDRVRRVVLRSPQPQARKVLEMTGLAKLLTVED